MEIGGERVKGVRKGWRVQLEAKLCLGSASGDFCPWITTNSNNVAKSSRLFHIRVRLSTSLTLNPCHK